MALLLNLLALALTLFLAWLYLSGIKNALFWTYWWFDSLLHLVGGVVVGLYVCAVALRLALPPRQTLAFIAAVALVGVIAWEVFEYALGIIGSPFDTITDVAVGTAGAFLAWVTCAFIFFRRAS